MRRIALQLMLPASMLMSGCLPQVLHGPRVDDGTSGVINLGLGRQFSFRDRDDDGGGDPFNVPSLNLGLRQGFTGENGRIAVSIGLQSSAFGILLVSEENAPELLGATSFADVYVQPKRYVDAGSNFGVGLMTSTAVAAPYFQYGRTMQSGSSWHTTQGIMMTFRQDDGDIDDGLTMWMTGISWRDLSRTGHTAVNYNLDALIGRLNDQTEFLVTLSVTAELGLSGNR